MKNINKGFTLIEMMIVIAIIGVIVAFAVPSYLTYIIKGNRAGVQAEMMDIAGQLENHFLQKSMYTSGFLTNIQNARTATVAGTNPKYIIGIASIASEQGFVITATPQIGTGQDEDECGVLTLNNFNIKGAELPSTCW